MTKAIERPNKAILFHLAEGIARPEMLRAFARANLRREWKSDNTPVTIADKKINYLVIKCLAKRFPQVSVIGEEERRMVEGSRYTVLVDPIDGTVPFMCALPTSAFCLSVFDGHFPIIGLIHDPFLNRTWFAEKGKGAFLGRKRIRVSDRRNVGQSVIALHFWSQTEYKLDEVRGQIAKDKGKWLHPSSVGIFGGLIACGKVDASIAPCKEGWETGAMQVLVEEAGGKATDIHGDELLYDGEFRVRGHIISNGHFHNELVEMVKASEQRSL